MAKMSDAQRAETLALEAAGVTKMMDELRGEIHRLSERRARLWSEAVGLGMSRARCAHISGLHHSQAQKVIDREGNLL